MTFTFAAAVAWDPVGNKPVKNTSFQVYATTDTGYTTPLAITDPFNNPIAGNILNSGSQGVFPQFNQATNAAVVITDPAHTYAWTINCVPTDAATANFISTGGSATNNALAGTYTPKWLANTAYTVNQIIVNPTGDLVRCTTAHTSAGSYDSTKFAVNATDSNSATSAALSATYATLDANGKQPVHKGEIFVNVKDFGAKGDRTTDDSAAIQAALNSIDQTLTYTGTAGGTVYFPPGHYKCLTGLTLLRGIRLLGAGSIGNSEDATNALGSSIYAGTAGMTLFKIDNGSTVNQVGPTFEHLVLGDMTGNTATLVYMRNTNRTSFRRVNFKNAAVGVRGDMVSLASGGDCSWWLIEGCSFWNCNTGYQSNIGGGGTISNSDFNACANYAIDNDGYSAMRIYGNKFDVAKAGAVGIRHKGYASLFYGNQFELTGSVTGMVIDGDTTLYPTPPAGQGNIVMASEFTGHGTGTTGISLTANARDTQYAGLWFTAISTNITDSGSTNTGFVIPGDLHAGPRDTTYVLIGPQGTSDGWVDVKSNLANASLNLRAKGTNPIIAMSNLRLDGLTLDGGINGTTIGYSGGKLGFFGTAPTTKPALTYSRATETAAQTQIRTALVSLGLVTDSTTA